MFVKLQHPADPSMDRFGQRQRESAQRPPFSYGQFPQLPRTDTNRAHRIADEFARLAGTSSRRRSNYSPADVWARLVADRWAYLAMAHVACHESGHCVAMIDVGIRPHYAHLDADESVLGAARFASMAGDDKTRAIVALCGAAAEQRFYRELAGDPTAICHPSPADMQFIPRDRTARNTLAQLAAKKVSGLWIPIVAVAKSLLLKGRITGQEIITIAAPYRCYFDNRRLFVT